MENVLARVDGLIDGRKAVRNDVQLGDDFLRDRRDGIDVVRKRAIVRGEDDVEQRCREAGRGTAVALVERVRLEHAQSIGRRESGGGESARQERLEAAHDGRCDRLFTRSVPGTAWREESHGSSGEQRQPSIDVEANDFGREIKMNDGRWKTESWLWEGRMDGRLRLIKAIPGLRLPFETIHATRGARRLLREPCFRIWPLHVTG